MTDVRHAFEGESAGVAPFPGLAPRHAENRRDDRRTSRLAAGLRRTLPIVIASAMTVGLNLTGPVLPASATPKKPPKPKAGIAAAAEAAAPRASAATVAAPRIVRAAVASGSTYVVKAGDTVSGIAARHGVTTASLLALNGLTAKSIIYPGQRLRISGATATTSASTTTRYTVKSGDTVTRIARAHGVTVQAVLSANRLRASSIIYPGQKLTIPGSKIVPVSNVTPTTPSTGSQTYVVKSGDTVSAIAARFGVTTASVLAANGLSASSIIYPGSKLTIPASGSGGSSSSTITKLSAEQKGNARTIIRVARELGVPDYGIIIALATAMQESSLRNIPYGDRDSVGLFQQRTSTGWGPVSTLMDPAASTRLFFLGNPGKTRGLLGVSNWQNLPLTVAAQKVQISAYPDAYAKWEASARAWYAELG